MGCLGHLSPLPLVLVAAIVTAVVVIATRRTGPGPRARPDGPEAVLAHRFAIGAIDVDEYHERAAALRSLQATPTPRRRA